MKAKRAKPLSVGVRKLDMMSSPVKRAAGKYKSKFEPEDIEDFQQEAYLRILQTKLQIESATKGKTADDKRGYVYRIAKNAITDCIRKAVKQRYFETNSKDFQRSLQDSICIGYADEVNYENSLPTDSMPGLEEKGQNWMEHPPLHVLMMKDRIADAWGKLTEVQSDVMLDVVIGGASTREFARAKGKSQFYPRHHKKLAMDVLRKNLGGVSE